MLQSMTGFGRAIAEVNNHKITVEVKSLNSKQLDLNFRAPSSLRELEITLRATVAEKLERGKVDVSIAMESLEGADTSAHINIPALNAYKDQILRASEALGIPVPTDWYSVLMRLPEAVRAEQSGPVTEDETAVIHG